MQVKKIDGNYEFTCSTVKGEFIVKMILTDNGGERLDTQPVDVPGIFPARDLEPGTIEKAIGKERWENFKRMKDKGFEMMFIDAHKQGFFPHTF